MWPARGKDKAKPEKVAPFYRCLSTSNGEFAEANAGNSSVTVSECPHCHKFQHERNFPLRICWELQSTDYPDLTIASQALLAQDDPARILKANFDGFRFEAVEFLDSRECLPYYPKGTNKREPYDGPNYVELYPTCIAPLDEKRSVYRVKEECPVCGAKWLDIRGLGELTFDLEGKFAPIARSKGYGLAVVGEHLMRAGLFRIDGLHWLCASQSLVDCVKGNDWQGLGFLELGDIWSS